MRIRPATERDIPAIVDLLKLSLRDSGVPKSEAYWRWKHLDNPFGRSPILLAEEDHTLAGVRAFMTWKWTSRDQQFYTLRPVDTATHPNFRRRGIFKKLTLALLEQSKAQGVDFLFNTPNAQSRPGYLKMGWKNWGRIQVCIRPVWPYRPAWEVSASLKLKFRLDAVLDNWPSKTSLAGNSTFYTYKDARYYRWRYLECPVVPYRGIGNDAFILIFSIRRRRPGLEIRIVDLIRFEPDIQSNLRALINELSTDLRPAFISIAPGMASGNMFLPSLGIGPKLAVRELNLSQTEIPALKNWGYSLGDLELF